MTNVVLPKILDVPEKLLPVILRFNEFRYFLIEGGRGSAKSQTVARFLLYLTSLYKLRVFCGREIQASIEESVYTLFKDLIGANNLDYDVLLSRIEHNLTKSVLRFRGFREQGAVNIQGIEGADIFWIEEAQAITKNTLDIIIPTIRKQKSKIFFTMNRYLEDDPVYVAFKDRHDCLHIHIDYFENKHCPEVLKKEAEECRRKNLEDYRHIWLGEPLPQAINAAFRNVEDCATGSIKEPEPGFEYVLGVDLAKSVDYTVLAVLNTRTKNFDYIERMDNENRSSWNYQEEKVFAVAKKYNDAIVVPDSTGVGDPLVERWNRRGLRVFHTTKDDSSRETPGIKFSLINKENIVEKLKVAIELKLITFPPIQFVIDELKDFRCETTRTGACRYSAPEGKHDDCVIAMALALWGIRQEVYETWQSPKEKTQADEFWDRVRKDLRRNSDGAEENVAEDEDAEILSE